MPAVNLPIRIKTGTEAARGSATINAREPHVTSDRRELWIGGDMLGARDYEALAPAASTGNTSLFAGSNALTTAANKANIREFLVKLTIGAGGGSYTRTIVLPVTGRRAGDVCQVKLLMPASANPTVDFRDATSGGTALLITAANSAGTVVGDASKAREYFGLFVYEGTAWVRWDFREML